MRLVYVPPATGQAAIEQVGCCLLLLRVVGVESLCRNGQRWQRARSSMRTGYKCLLVCGFSCEGIPFSRAAQPCPRLSLSMHTRQTARCGCWTRSQGISCSWCSRRRDQTAQPRPQCSPGMGCFTARHGLPMMFHAGQPSERAAPSECLIENELHIGLGGVWCALSAGPLAPCLCCE